MGTTWETKHGLCEVRMDNSFFPPFNGINETMSTLRQSEVICMQKQPTDMKPGFKKKMFLPFKAFVIKHDPLEA